jgi:uncharacterized protein (TIGR03437 family)
MDGSSERMRAEWNRRAREDANYYVAFGRREQDDEEFFASAADVVRALEGELRRLRARRAALEIGCGPGRLMRFMARHFGQVHGVDVSDEMVRLAQEKLRHVPNAYPHHAPGSDLRQFGDGTFDFVYSYAVFQHIPSREVVLGYLAEARRVLASGGVLKVQVNGLPETAQRYDTWSGVRLQAAEVAGFARAHDFALLALEGAGTQYMWTTWRKMPEGWSRHSAHARSGAAPLITNAVTGEAAVPAAGRLASMALWIKDLPGDCDLNHLEVRADGRPCRLTYLGEPDHLGVSQLNATIPEGVRTGMVPVDLAWDGQPLAARGWIRVIPPGPAVPRVCAVTDGVNLLSGTRVSSGIVKVTIEEMADPAAFRVSVDGRPVGGIEFFRTDPLCGRYEVNFPLPGDLAPGAHTIGMTLGRRVLPPAMIEVA